MDHNLDTEIACILREIALRKHVYPRLVKSNKLTQKQADQELATMEAVYQRLVGLQEAEALQLFPLRPVTGNPWVQRE